MEDNNQIKKKGGFTGSIGFVLAAAGSAVGVGNIWRFPYLAAKDGGGLFILVYVILALTLGFALLTTDIAIGRKTGKSAIEAYTSISKKWKFLGVLTYIVPSLILTYYSVIGGWATKYMVDYMTFQGKDAAETGYFKSFIESYASPIVYTLIFLALTAFIVYLGVEKGIEKFSKIVMPGLFIMIIGISIFSLTLSYEDSDGTVRTGLQGAAIYLIPNFEGLTLSRFLEILLDATGQLFYSLSVSMGIMITFGSYVKKDVNLNKSVNQIEFFDTLCAVLAGLMIVPAVYVFSGLDGMQQGTGLMFVSLPKVFLEMGFVGGIIGLVFFFMVVLAALTSCVSIMEAVVANTMSLFKTDRKKTALIVAVLAAIAAVVVCLGYNLFYFSITLPNGTVAQILDLVDYISNSVLMTAISLGTCIFIGWKTKPEWVIEEVELGGVKFTRKVLYKYIIKYIAPIVMLILFVKAFGII